MRRDANEEIGRVGRLMPETQDEAESLITANDFSIPALREDSENPEEKTEISRANSGWTSCYGNRSRNAAS